MLALPSNLDRAEQVAAHDGGIDQFISVPSAMYHQFSRTRSKTLHLRDYLVEERSLSIRATKSQLPVCLKPGRLVRCAGSMNEWRVSWSRSEPLKVR